MIVNMMPSPTELEYFLEVCTTLNLSRASERIGISQPTLSIAMKRLEAALGAEVFFRHKNGVTLTQAGKQLLLHGKQLLAYWEETQSKALSSMREVQGYFTLGCHTSIGIYMASQVLPALLSEHPKLQVHLKHDLSRKITESVINLSLDLGIVVNPILHADLIIKKLFDDEITFWVSHETRNINSENTPIYCDPALIQSQTLLKKCKKVGIHSKRIIHSNSLEVIAHLTANGNGIGILPARVAKTLFPKKLKKMPNAPTFADRICLIYRPENNTVAAIQAIIATIKQFGHIPALVI